MCEYKCWPHFFYIRRRVGPHDNWVLHIRAADALIADVQCARPWGDPLSNQCAVTGKLCRALGLDGHGLSNCKLGHEVN